MDDWIRERRAAKAMAEEPQGEVLYDKIETICCGPDLPNYIMVRLPEGTAGGLVHVVITRKLPK